MEPLPSTLLLLPPQAIRSGHWEESQFFARCHNRIRRLLVAPKSCETNRNRDGYRSDEAFNMENTFHEQRNRAIRAASSLPEPTALLVIGEADRLRVAGFEQLRNIFDHGQHSLVQDTIAEITRITGGAFRLPNRLLTQMERILGIDALQAVTKQSWKRHGKG